MTDLDTFVKVSRAMQRGTISRTLSISHSRHSGTHIEVPRMDYVREREMEQATLAWLKRTFGEGHTRRWGGHITRRVHGRNKAFDLLRWCSPADSVEFLYGGDHVHGKFVAHVEDGEVVWRCGDCRGRISQTQARAAGLIPAIPVHGRARKVSS